RAARLAAGVGIPPQVVAQRAAEASLAAGLPPREVRSTVTSALKAVDGDAPAVRLPAPLPGKRPASGDPAKPEPDAPVPNILGKLDNGTLDERLRALFTRDELDSVAGQLSVLTREDLPEWFCLLEPSHVAVVQQICETHQVVVVDPLFRTLGGLPETNETWAR